MSGGFLRLASKRHSPGVPGPVFLDRISRVCEVKLRRYMALMNVEELDELVDRYESAVASGTVERGEVRELYLMVEGGCTKPGEARRRKVQWPAAALVPVCVPGIWGDRGGREGFVSFGMEN